MILSSPGRSYYGDWTHSTLEQLEGVACCVSWVVFTGPPAEATGAAAGHESVQKSLTLIVISAKTNLTLMQVAVWRCRGKVPLGIEVTACLVEILSRQVLADAYNGCKCRNVTVG